MTISASATRMRLDRFVSQELGLSRAQAKRLLSQGRAHVDGEVVRDPAHGVTPQQAISVDDAMLEWPRHHYLMLHKPLGVVCSTSDPTHTPVHQLVDRPWAERLHAAGRLDADSSGLVLLTSDGAWSHALTSPRRHCDKHYRVRLSQPLDTALVERFAAGIVLNDSPVPTLPATLIVLDSHNARIVLREGRYHQVRRMFAACGNHVDALHRERIGPLPLDSALAPGQWRELSPAEVELATHG
ncbi:MAG TPA: pseudouridine synthase [Hyphomicrobiales bacterium]|nr:pseudouridine synthase [Hyphomicrobiales bacterium]